MKRSAGVALTTVTLGLVAGPAMADTTYPLAPTGFATGADGWRELVAECRFGEESDPVTSTLCRVDTAHDATAGSPQPGSLEVRLRTVILGGPLVARADLGSPPFAVEAAGPLRVTLRMRDRRPGFPFPATATTEAVLVQGDAVVPLTPASTSTAASDWSDVTFSSADPVAPGTYELRLLVRMTSTPLGLLHRHMLGIDSVAATVDDGRASLVRTLPATGVTETAATLNARVRSDDESATAVSYELRPAGTEEFSTLAGPEVPPGEEAEPNPVAAGGLTGCTDYEVRAVGTTPAGAKRGELVTFTTKCPGSQGAQGAQGAQGPAGPAAPQGEVGPGGGQVAGSSTTVVLGSTEAGRRLLRLDARGVTVRTTGRFKGRGRLRIFCRRSTVAQCMGIVKVRTVDRINPASRGTRPRRRVTFVDSEYQLPRGAVGYAVFQLNQQRLDLLKRLGSVRTRVNFTVLDAQGNRQTVSRVVRLRAGR